MRAWRPTAAAPTIRDVPAPRREMGRLAVVVLECARSERGSPGVIAARERPPAGCKLGPQMGPPRIRLTQPFTFTLPGFETTELAPWEEAGERWRRLRVIWPSYLATHSSEQTLYFNDDGQTGTPRLRRRDQRRHERRALRVRLWRGRGHQAPHPAQDLPAHPRRPVARRAPHRLDRSQRDRVYLTQARARQVGRGPAGPPSTPRRPQRRRA